MNKKELTELGKTLHEALVALVTARASILHAETLLHPLVTEGQAPEFPSGIGNDVLEMWNHAGEAQSMIDYAEHDWQRIDRKLADINSGGQQALLPPEQLNGTGKQRVIIIGGLSDDDPNPDVDL